MAKKRALFGGRVVKVENRSAFDKSRLNALTTGVGTITPILKQLVIPSSGRLSLSIHAELPPLATNAFLRTHLKVEAFYCPLRLLYGGFQSWMSGEEIYNPHDDVFTRAELPHGFIPSFTRPQQGDVIDFDQDSLNDTFGHSSLTDYFNVKFHYDGNGNISIPSQEVMQTSLGELNGMKVNLLPYICYHLIYHHYYRNKSVQRPVFCPPDLKNTSPMRSAAHLPFISHSDFFDVCLGSDIDDENGDHNVAYYLQDGGYYNFNDFTLDNYCLAWLRQRNYGDDYFTAARPSAQAGSPVQVQTDAQGRFTISALRVANAKQEFEEVNSYATPDYVQTNAARYGVDLSAGIAQKPILLGSADFPMFTKGVELNSNSAASTQSGDESRNPFNNQGILGATAGRASANGHDFVCDFDVKEAGYIMVMATLVPEANYGDGISHDMRIFIDPGDLVDLPCGLLEHVGDEPIYEHELLIPDDGNLSRVFGYVQRYLWHKCGGENEVHGLFRPRQSLEAFVPQRIFTGRSQISSSFLAVPKTALDSVAAVESGVSQYGVMLDCAINLSVSEPLSESALPALSNPAVEHGRSVYLSNGGSKLA